MNRCARRRAVWICTAALTLAGGVAVSGQNSLARARDLYAAAAYEEALDLLTRLPAGDPGRTEDEHRSVEQYRAFCLLALGRHEEAERVIEALIWVDPSSSPATDVSPRVRTAFADVRQRTLPMVIRHNYDAAKAAFDHEEFELAAGRFRQVLDMLNDPDLGEAVNRQPLSDLRTLSTGFHELSVASIPPPPPPPPPVVEEPPPPVRPAIYGSGDAAVVPPVTVSQQLPPHTRSGFVSTRGVIEIVIDEQGAVESATMRASVDERYDRRALAAAANWRYKPAMLDGMPVKYRKLIEIALQPVR